MLEEIGNYSEFGCLISPLLNKHFLQISIIFAC